MSGRGSESGLPQGRRGRGRRSSFFRGWLLQEATADPGASESSSELELSSDDYIMQEVKAYTETGVAMINVQPQGT